MSLSTVKNDPVLIDLPMPIVTPRLLLRPVMAGDGAALYEAKAETWDGQLDRWMSFSHFGLGTAESCETNIRAAVSDFMKNEGVMLVGIERTTGMPVLWTGLHGIDWRVRSATTGYWVRRQAQGLGYATESANAVLRYAFGALGLRRVGLGHAAENLASRRVIEKLGYEREGILRHSQILPHDGTVTDMWIYARLSVNGLPPLDVRWGDHHD